MKTYVVRCAVSVLPVMLIVSFCVFSLVYLAPGDPAAVIAGDQASPADIAEVRARLGLDQPFLARYGAWVWQVAQGNLGESLFSGLPVTQLIAQRIEPTLSILALTLPFSLLLAIPAGAFAATRHNALADRALTGLAILSYSLPAFLVAYLLAMVFAVQLRWLPVQGYSPLGEGVGPWLSHLILPVLTLSCSYIAIITRTTRSAMLETLNQDYVRTARAKGLSRATVLYGHALRNAGVPIATIVGIGFASLIGGAAITETVFAIPGVGRLVVDAVLRRDYPIIQGVVLLFSAVFVLVNLLVDLIYAVIDPRVSYA
ncbi:MAG: ABC transporter permease [Thermomicrobiales bacterium]